MGVLGSGHLSRLDRPDTQQVSVCWTRKSQPHAESKPRVKHIPTQRGGGCSRLPLLRIPALPPACEPPSQPGFLLLSWGSLIPLVLPQHHELPKAQCPLPFVPLAGGPWMPSLPFLSLVPVTSQAGPITPAHCDSWTGAMAARMHLRFPGGHSWAQKDQGAW